MIGIRRKCFNRSFVGVLALALMLALAGCGGDDEEPAAGSGTETATETQAETTETTESVPAPTAEEPQAPTETEVPTSPEDGPGGAGDEEPARTLAVFTGDGGRITPRVIRVPAFISIRIELGSADGLEYALKFEGETIRVSGGLASVSTTIDGMRQGESVVGTPVGRGNRVRVEATAEPGP